MGPETESVAEPALDPSARLIAAGEALLAQGDSGFSLTRLCADAGVTLEEFHVSFASKVVLLQQLMEKSGAEQPRPEAPQADPWLERRLRVFERTLMALEEKAERRERETHQSIIQLEEKLAALGSVTFGPVTAVRDRRASDRNDNSTMAVFAGLSGPLMRPEQAVATPAEARAGTQAQAQPEPIPRSLRPLEQAPVARADSEFLGAGRRAAQAHARALESKPCRRVSTRFLVLSALAATVLQLCAALTLVVADHASASPAQGTAHRGVALTPMEKLMARADSGDLRAEKALALAYLHGEGVGKDLAAALRWAEAAAEQGDAEAQYLTGSLYRNGATRKPDPDRAFTWFANAAANGNLKAMHNLAIAFVQGSGTAKDDTMAATWFARAAALGYVDSAFDLAVLYEKGEGVPQDGRMALHWYETAAAAGDSEAAARTRLLKEQAHL